MLNHSGVPITIDLIAELFADPLFKGASSMNIVVRFRSSGFWPFIRDIFSENDFMPAFVTDRPYEDQADQEGGPSNTQLLHQMYINRLDQRMSTNRLVHQMPIKGLIHRIPIKSLVN